MILFSSGACHMRAFLCCFSGFPACFLFKEENHIKSLASLTVGDTHSGCSRSAIMHVSDHLDFGELAFRVQLIEKQMFSEDK